MQSLIGGRANLCQRLSLDTRGLNNRKLSRISLTNSTPSCPRVLPETGAALEGYLGTYPLSAPGRGHWRHAGGHIQSCGRWSARFFYF